MNSNLNKIKGAVASELDRSFKERDPNISAALMTTLITALALVTTQHCRGDQKTTADCLDASAQLLHEEAAHLLPIAAFMRDQVKPDDRTAQQEPKGRAMTNPKSKRRQIIELRKKGRPVDEIVAKTGISRGHVSTVVAEFDRKVARIEEREMKQ